MDLHANHRPVRRRRRPEQGVLYQVLDAHLETFLQQAEGDGSRRGLPPFVIGELRRYLDCGQLSAGLARVWCESCRAEEHVAYACKGRAFCPSCGGRRMADTAAHLVDRVFPDVPVRQWVLSLPFELRYLLARDPELLGKVRRIYVRAIFGLLKCKARQLGIEDPRPGAVVAVQRFDSAIRLNVHLHGLFADGVFTCDPGHGGARFRALPAPTDAEVARVSQQIATRVLRLLHREGLVPDPDAPADTGEDDDPSALDACQAAAVQGRIALGPDAGKAVQRLGRLRDLEPDFRPGELCANVHGFSLHAATAVAAGKSDQLESLCRYVLRPPIVQDRLSWTRDGHVRYSFRRAFRDGSTGIVLSPHALIERLAALVPRPHKNLTTYHGVFAPAASYRTSIVPAPPENAEDPPVFRTCQHHRKQPRAGDVPHAPTIRRPRRYSWAQLLRRVFGIDITVCPRCGGRRQLLTFITDPSILAHILDHLGPPSQRSPTTTPRAPPEQPALDH